MRRGASHPSDGRPSRQRRRDERDDDSRSSRKRSDASSLLRRCWRVVQRRQCYVALLIGSVIANVLQLVWFFASRPGNGGQRSSLLLKERARSSYRKLLGAISSLGPSVAPSARGFAGAATGGSSSHNEIGGSRSGSAPAAVAPSLPAVPPPPSPPPLPLPVRHPKYRIAFTVPWIGKTFPSWFPYFLSSCRRSTFLADWLIFHEGAKLPDPQEVPPNVIFHDVGRDGLGRLFGTRLAEALGIYESEMQQKMVGLFQVAFREFAYIVTEYKPTHGTVFSDYLTPYTHWSYTDIDMLIGDLPLHIELDELANYDIFTYHFGDVFRLYLRGQFAAHRNTPKINRLWSECPHLGSGLVKELETKLNIVRRLAAEGKHGRTRFISAEGCYSWIVASTPQMRVKFASKAFADWSDDREFYVVDGAVRKCSVPSLVWQPRADGSAGAPTHAPSTSTANENSRITTAAARASSSGGGNVSCTPFGPRIRPHSLRLPGVQRPHGDVRLVAIHTECSRWVEEKYRLCADLSEEESPFYNVVLSNGTWSAQRFANDEPDGCLEGAFLHLQRWKGEYKRLSYGGRGMARLRGRRIFKLSRFGVTPFDATYDDASGADLAALREAPQEKDLTEMNDDEFEKQLDVLRSAVREEGGSRRRQRQRPR